MKKNLLMIICMMVFFWLIPDISVQAAEDSTGKDWEYSYSIYSYMEGTGNITSTTLDAVLYSDYPVYGYISQEHFDDQGYAVITYAACIPDDIDSKSFTCRVEGTETTLWASGTEQEKQPNLTFIGINYSEWVDSLKDSSQTWGKSVYVGSSYAIDFPVFENRETLVRYLELGDESGWLNKPKEIKLENFSLLDFICDNSIRAEWYGITGIEEISSIEDVNVLIHPSYFTILEDNEVEQKWQQPSDIEVPFMNFGFYSPYSYYFENYPYKNGQLILDFTPVYRLQSEVYKGQTISVYFDADGNISSLNYPAASLKSVYDDDFYLKSMLVTEDGWRLERKYNFMWTGSSIDNIVDYYYSEVKVQIKVRVGQDYDSYGLLWVDYPLNDIVSIKSNRLTIDMNEVQNYVKSLNSNYSVYDSVSKGGHNFKDVVIRLIPYYKTYDTYCYGRAIEYRLDADSGGNLLISNGDVFSGDAIDYSKVHESYFDNNGVFDGLFPDSNESGEVDFSFLTDVFKNFLNGIIDFFKYAGSFPILVKDVLSFMPSYFFQIITFSFLVVFVLRILGR